MRTTCSGDQTSRGAAVKASCGALGRRRRAGALSALGHRIAGHRGKYHAYLYRQARDIERFRENESAELPRDLDYSKLALLSTEEKEKLNRVRPATLGAASRISGITAASLVSLLKFARKLPRNATSTS
jgi:tRNA U34 5-carboxymethylaminomethyl modifying enzyme MnmG/GidA